MDTLLPKLYSTTARSPENKAVLDTLGNLLTSVALSEPREKIYDFYEYLASLEQEKGGDASV